MLPLESGGYVKDCKHERRFVQETPVLRNPPDCHGAPFLFGVFMNQSEREEIIEKSGVVVADKIASIEDQLDELFEFLKVIRICTTVGGKLVPDPTK
jgi:hypothetical protein